MTSNIRTLGKPLERECEKMPMGNLRAKLDGLLDAINDAIQSFGRDSHQARIARERFGIADRIAKRRESMIE